MQTISIPNPNPDTEVAQSLNYVLIVIAACPVVACMMLATGCFHDIVGCLSTQAQHGRDCPCDGCCDACEKGCYIMACPFYFAGLMVECCTTTMECLQILIPLCESLVYMVYMLGQCLLYILYVPLACLAACDC